MQDVRIIKRYSNRRLYDTVTSRYITLEEIQDLVLKQITFKVIDDNTNDDLTNYVLLQIISSQENGRLPFFTTNILENIIRYYGHPLQKIMSDSLEKCFSFINKDNGFQEYSQKNPVNMMTEIAKQNLDAWQALFTQYLNKVSQNENDEKTRSKNSKQSTTK